MNDWNRRTFLVRTGAAAGLGLVLGSGLARRVLAAGPDPVRSGYIAVEGGRIWFRMNGIRHFSGGKTPLLIIHGGPGMSHHYLLPLTDLSDERPVILYDQLDSGNSDRPGREANWTVDRFVSEIDCIRDALGLDRLFILGNSWGGTVAAEYAIGRPEGLEGLVLASPLISTERWIADNTVYRQALPEDVQRTLDRHEAAGTIDHPDYQDAVMVFYLRHFNRMDPWPEELNHTFEVFSTDLYQYMWGNTEFNCTGTLRDYDATDRLGRIRAPVLYTCGQYDESTPQACRDFARQTPGARVEVIRDASHTAFLEQRSAYMGVVRAFLNRIEG